MIFKPAFVTNLLLASAALAIPSSRLEARLARRRLSRQTQPLNHVDAPASAASNYSSNWAGAVLAQNNAPFNSVTGTFTVPALSGSTGAASAWVGIDGNTCQNAILQTGVDFIVDDSGEVSYMAWHEWYPDYSHDFPGISINAGDDIRATVNTYSMTAGTAVIENLTTGQTVTKNLASSSALCGQDAEWIVEDFEEDGGLVTFADFGTVTFSSASATGFAVTYSPSGATTVNIQQNSQVLTSVSTSDSSVTVHHL